MKPSDGEAAAQTPTKNVKAKSSTGEPRHRVSGRTKAHQVRDSTLRRLVDPSTFREPFEANEAELEILTASQLNALSGGLRVRIQAMSQGLSRPKQQPPGPGAPPPSTRSHRGPKWGEPVSAMSETDRATRSIPGPGAYLPKPPPTTRKFQMAFRLETADASGRNLQPGPCSYSLPPTPMRPMCIGRKTSRPASSEARPGPQHYSMSHASAFAPRPGNASQGPRFPRRFGKAPGPGEYDIRGMTPKQTSFSERRVDFH